MKSFKFDTHVHTMETSPCGRVKGAEVALSYKEAGYQGIVITDHFYNGFFDRLSAAGWKDKVDMYLAGYREALAKGENIGLDVILGMEIRFNESFNDYLVFGIDENFLKAYPDLYTLSLEEFRSLAQKHDLLIYQAHPFRKNMIPADPRLLDGIEVYNGNPRHDSHNDLALDYANENNLKLISGSDFHQHEDLARGGIVIAERIKSSEELLDILKNDKIISLITT